MGTVPEAGESGPAVPADQTETAQADARPTAANDNIPAAADKTTQDSHAAATHEAGEGKPAEPVTGQETDTTQGRGDDARPRDYTAQSMEQADRLRGDLAAAEAANPLVGSLKETGELPDNYVTKDEARAAGWEPGKAVGNSIPDGQLGGHTFENEDGEIVPSAPGRTWYEADVGLDPSISRSNQPGTRLLYSNDGLAYVTSDHYQSVYQLPNWK